MSASVTIQGAEGVHDMLKDYMEPLLPKRLTHAMLAGAKTFVPGLRSEGARVSKRMGRAATANQSGKGIRGTAGNKGNRDPKAFAGYRIKTAWFSHIVIGGSKDHGPRRAPMLAWKGRNGPIFAKHVRGVKANPIPSRVEAQYETQAYKAINTYLDNTEAK